MDGEPDLNKPGEFEIIVFTDQEFHPFGPKVQRLRIQGFSRSPKRSSRREGPRV
jgi:hypothetical protein